MGVQPGSPNSPLHVKKPVVAPATASPGMQKLVKEAQKLPGQVKAMSSAVKSADAAHKPGSTPKK